jgi:hypothetical protein
MTTAPLEGRRPGEERMVILYPFDEHFRAGVLFI